jgi:hypothetical protein
LATAAATPVAFANAASAGRACMRVEFVDEMHLNAG